ncbi:FagA protein [Pseudomonas sp. CDFA 602]|uniref:FagA protein n=1 Tax=Pseudomonas californiensis TaxID=2829823 RepID=UPI001E45005A|nr:FagA protein [Pseudomonas californiensis]MCD5993287.1 FagA protein [Pseudomonas californiensis]MCD5998922.1 FagA protein [Pseudomonas californiensis]
MGSVLQELPYLENWRGLGLRIRCALDPDEPRVIEHYLAEGRYLARFTATPQAMIAETSFRLLMDSARDTVLPWHWRCLCLDQAWRPLRDIEALASSPARRRRWEGCVHQLAFCILQPSISLSELVQGHCDE